MANAVWDFTPESIQSTNDIWLLFPTESQPSTNQLFAPVGSDAVQVLTRPKHFVWFSGAWRRVR